MALTYRTGSGGKGSALTIEELDNNFRHFTGSHSVTGSLNITGSLEVTGSFLVTGSVGMNSLITLTHVSESLDFSGDAEAEAGGVPLGGVYRSGNVLAIRIQ